MKIKHIQMTFGNSTGLEHSIGRIIQEVKIWQPKLKMWKPELKH
jgi:hypothetical protein